MLTTLLSMYFLVLSISSGIGMFFYRKYDGATRFICILLATTLVSEIVSRYFAYHYNNNNAVFHFFNVIELYLISIFFFKSILLRHFKVALICITVIYPLLGILNALFLQPLDVLNSNFIVLESFIVMAMALYSLYRILINEKIHTIQSHPQFWFWVCLLIYFSATFFFWPIIKILYVQKRNYYLAIYMQIVINIIAYSGIGSTLFFYRKMNRNAQQ